MNLNASQQQAVTCSLKPTLVIAGPGSGKTHVIINRVHYMIEQLACAPQHILVVTFSKLAAEEMKMRYEARYGLSPVHFGTLHSIFYRILRRSNPVRYHIDHLILEDKKKSLLQQLLKDMDTDEGEEFLEGFMKHLSLMQNQLISIQHYYPEGISRDAFIELAKRYEAYKERHGQFDFDDMLIACHALLKNDSTMLRATRNQFQYILIDEFQDINLVQFEIIKMITEETGQIFVVGDDDQSIYQFRGAKPAFLLDFKKHFPATETIYLNTNYRSTKEILSHSLALISHNQKRYQKSLTTPNKQGLPPYFITCKDAKEEALLIVNEITKLKSKGTPISDMAIIYRTNLQARPIVEALLAASIPFCLRDGMVSLYDQWITQDILAYFYLAQNINQTELALRIMNKPKRYISRQAMEVAKSSGGHLFMNLLGLEQLTQWQKDYLQQLLFDLQVLKEKNLVEALHYIRHHIGYDQYVKEYAAYRKMSPTSLLEVLEDLEDSMQGYHSFEEWEVMLKTTAEEVKKQTKQRPGEHDVLNLMTMHGSKGLEFNCVFIMDVVEDILPHHKSQLAHEIEEERRLFYVAMTRAKEELRIYIPKEKHGKPVANSPFIDEIHGKMLENKLQIGQQIKHRQLGIGEIIEVFKKNVISVKFKNGQVRKIDSQYAIKNGIITWEGEKNETI